MCAHKVNLLRLLAKAWEDGTDWVKIYDSYYVYDGKTKHKVPQACCHARRLLWFGLINQGEIRSATYQINQDGVDFLKGVMSVPKVIFCKSGHVVKRSDERVFIRDVKDVVFGKDYWDGYAGQQISARG